MRFWDRAASIQIGTAIYDIEDFDFDFEVNFEDGKELPEATIRIKNLASSTRSSMARGDLIIINAGYKGDLGNIFVGQISSVEQKHEGTEWTTEIVGVSAMREWLSREVSKTYQATKASFVIRDLLNILGIEPAVFELVRDANYPYGKYCRGKVGDIVSEIVTRDCESRFIISNGLIIINDPHQPVTFGTLLSAQTGMLRNTTGTMLVPITNNLLEPLNEEEKLNLAILKSRSTLLNPAILAGSLVEVQSNDLNGTFIAVRGQHVGFRNGDWLTKVELREF